MDEEIVYAKSTALQVRGKFRFLRGKMAKNTKFLREKNPKNIKIHEGKNPKITEGKNPPKKPKLLREISQIS